MFSHGENIEEYFKAIGDVDIMHHYRNYKIHMHENGKMYRLSEYIGDLGRITNTMELDVESPFRVPGDKKGWKSIYFLNFLIYLPKFSAIFSKIAKFSAIWPQCCCL